MKTCKHPDCNYPVFSNYYCKQHQQDRTDEKWVKSLNKATGRTFAPKPHQPSTYKRTPTGEAEMFTEIWSEREHVSFLTGEPLLYAYKSDLWYNLFAHCLSKGKYPALRLIKENIILLTPFEHHLLDQGNSDQRRKYENEHDCMFEKIYALQEELKLKYKLKS